MFLPAVITDPGLRAALKASSCDRKQSHDVFPKQLKHTSAQEGKIGWKEKWELGNLAKSRAGEADEPDINTNEASNDDGSAPGIAGRSFLPQQTRHRRA